MEIFWSREQCTMGCHFSNGGPLPRHPSQLYEAVLEGFLLFTLWRIEVFTKVRHCAEF